MATDAIPHALQTVEHWRAARERAGRMLVALDFDGTLSAIVERPEQAVLLPAAQEALVRLADRADTDVAVVSGRGLDDVRVRVGIPELFYAGNHGLEIEGPGIRQVHEQAAAARPRLEHCRAGLSDALAGIEGVEVEDKVLTLSVHYRRVRDTGTEERVVAAVRRLCGGDPELRITTGKKVVEVRPDVEWDKGRATRFLLDALHAEGLLIPTLFVGDDVTDEDAFRVVGEHGAGIVVGREPPAETAATAWLRSPEEVAELLAALA